MWNLLDAQLSIDERRDRLLRVAERERLWRDSLRAKRSPRRLAALRQWLLRLRPRRRDTLLEVSVEAPR